MYEEFVKTDLTGKKKFNFFWRQKSCSNHTIKTPVTGTGADEMMV